MKITITIALVVACVYFAVLGAINGPLSMVWIDGAAALVGTFTLGVRFGAKK